MDEKNQDKIVSFTDLRVWQEGHRLVLSICKELKKFPAEERYGLVSQIRRAIISFTSNIAEGFIRPSYKEKLRFYYIALGSLVETQNQLLIARDLGYINKESFNQIADQQIKVHKMTNAFISSTKRYLQ